MKYLGDFAEDATVYFEFATYTGSTGASVDASATPAQADFTVYKDHAAMTLDAGTITVTDVGVGRYTVSVDMSNDADFTTGSDYALSFDPASITVDSQAVEAWIGSWSCENRFNSAFDRLGAPAGASVSADIATIDTNVDAVLVDTGTTIPGLIGTPSTDLAADIAAIAADQKPKKNTALSNIGIYLVSSTDHVTPATGVTPTVEISQDGGAFAAMNVSSTITEVSDGLYQLDLVAADMNADVVIIKVTGTGADPALLSISTVD